MSMAPALSAMLMLPLLALSAVGGADAFLHSPHPRLTTTTTTTLHSSASSSASSVRRPTPSRISETDNFREAKELSQKFIADCERLSKDGGEKKRVAIFGESECDMCLICNNFKPVD